MRPEILVSRTPNHRRVAKKAVFDAPSAKKPFSQQMGPFKGSINIPLYWLMDSVAVGVAVTTRKGDLLYANCRFLEMLGQPLFTDSGCRT